MYKTACFFTFILLFLANVLSAQEFVLVQNVRIEGNSRLKPHVVFLKSGIAPGDTLSLNKLEDELNQAAENLRRMRILDSVKWSLIDGAAGKTLVWHFQKSLNFFLVPYVEAADRDINVWLDRFDASADRLNFGALVYLFNLAGHNDVLDLTVTTGFNQDYELFYFLPNIDREGKWSGLLQMEYLSFSDIAYQTLDNKEVFVNPEMSTPMYQQWYAKTGLQYKIKKQQWLEGSFSFYRRQASEQLFELNPNYLNSQRISEREYRLGLRHIFDTRNNRRFPTIGYRIESILSYSKFSTVRNDMMEFKLRGNNFVDLNAFGLLEFGLRSRMQLLQNPYGYRFSRSLGFNNTVVRGYELYSVPAANYWLMKLDYRYLVWNLEPFTNKIARAVGIQRDLPFKCYINLYADLARAYGDYQNHQQNDLIGQQLSGSGLGIDMLAFRRFLFSLQYSWNHRGESGLFIHFRFNRE